MASRVCREASSRDKLALPDTGGTRTAVHRGTDGLILVLERRPTATRT